MFNWIMISFFMLRLAISGEPMYAVAVGLFGIAAAIKDAAED